MELRAPVPYSILIWSSHIRTKVTTSCDMVTPHLNRDTTVAFTSLIYYYYLNLRDCNRLLSRGIAVALLRLLREVGEGVESVNYKEGVGQGGGVNGKSRGKGVLYLSIDQ